MQRGSEEKAEELSKEELRTVNGASHAEDSAREAGSAERGR